MKDTNSDFRGYCVPKYNTVTVLIDMNRNYTFRLIKI